MSVEKSVEKMNSFAGNMSQFGNNEIPHRNPIGYSCSEQMDCGSCNGQWPNCAWCSSAGKCIEASLELQTKVKRLNARVHVLYNVQEYQKSYGYAQRLDGLESVTGTECLVWIINSTSCSWVREYCSHVGSCSSCLSKTGGGCGWCQGSNRCVPGTHSGELTTSSQPGSCKKNGGTWVFGNWAKYMDHGEWEDTCSIYGAVDSPVPVPSAQERNSNDFRNFGQDDSRADQHAHRDFSVGILIGLISMFILLALTVFIVIKYRSVALSERGALPTLETRNVHADIMQAINEVGVDMEALELSRPSCCPKVVGQRRINNVADETSAEVDELASNVSEQSMPTCAVCLGALGEGDEARSLPCEHMFHMECIDSWLSKSRQCPVCRQVVTTAPIVPPIVRPPVAMPINSSVVATTVVERGVAQPEEWQAVHPAERAPVQPAEQPAEHERAPPE